jgi:hypothetical protein
VREIGEHVAASLRIEMADFEYSPFYEMGGPVGVHQLFGLGLAGAPEELTEALMA